MERILTTRSQRAIDINQILHAANFGAQDNLVGAHAVFLGNLSRLQRAYYHGFHHHVASFFGLVESRVLVHHSSKQSLIERAPVHANAHWLLILDRDFDHGAKVVIVLAANADVAGIDAVLG